MTPGEIELDERLKGFLDRLRAVPPLDSQVVARERAKYLAQGQMLRASAAQPPRRRTLGWMNHLALKFQRNLSAPRLIPLLAIFAAAILLFGGAGVTVYAAQGSLPEEPLYPVKTWSEDVRLLLAASSQGQVDLTLDFTARRVTEIARLQAGGSLCPQEPPLAYRKSWMRGCKSRRG